MNLDKLLHPNTIQLQGIGRCPARPASELKVGDLLSWNYSWRAYEVVSIVDVSAQFISIVERDVKKGTETTRRLKKDRLVVAHSQVLA